MRLSFTEYAEQMVHATIAFSSGMSVSFSGIYAKCTRVGRRPLWQSMENVGMGMDTPWLAAGDFNVVSSADERVGGSPANVTNMEEFNSSMFSCGLSTVDFDRSLFTWTNGTVWQRLDHVMVNSQWFLNAWRTHPQFLEVIREEWLPSAPGVGMATFHQKLMRVHRRLKLWSRKTFGNIFSRVKTAEGEYHLREAEFDSRRDTEARTLLHEARARYLRELSIEGAFWKQKAGIKWLEEGDANTRFFHAVVK
ncbi:uncharacterized protein [Coffea arabica]|uniref:Endonuclease/exonuclease/phosphatase domain-containing protein n=1 Tax=Coffea arabica TaxID=13443 RepID=A0ABM4WN03_COFAR